MMKILIVDDEFKARRLITNLLEAEYGKKVTLIQASNLPDAVALIKEEQPEVVLLDIRMPEYSGLDIVRFFDAEQMNFQIIFTTAYNEYAVEAFKTSASDYLLKPIDPDELFAAIKKAQNNIKTSDLNKKLSNLEEAFVKLSVKKIALEVPKGFMFVNHEDIIMFEADGMYTTVHLHKKPSQTICKPLKHFVDQLNDNPIFYKPQRSFLINLKYISEVKRNEGLYIILENGKSIAVSRDKREEFLNIIASVF